MGLRAFKPTSPGRRTMTVSDFSEITETKPMRKLVYGKSGTGARNNDGRTTVRFRGGGHKKRYRMVDFKRLKLEVPAVVKAIEYDPNRSARIARLSYKDGDWAYIIAPLGLNVGDSVVASAQADIKPGNCMPLDMIPLGTVVHNIELRPGKGAQLARSAGAGCQLIAKEGEYVTLRMPSGEMRLVFHSCRAVIGQVGNIDHENQSYGKAGRVRWLGWRPHNRGVSMNPVDHPHGGGEGKTSGGRHPVTPWGQGTRGKKTRNNERTDRFRVRRRGQK